MKLWYSLQKSINKRGKTFRVNLDILSIYFFTLHFFACNLFPQRVIAYSKSRIEALEKDVKYVQS